MKFHRFINVTMQPDEYYDQFTSIFHISNNGVVPSFVNGEMLDAKYIDFETEYELKLMSCDYGVSGKDDKLKELFKSLTPIFGDVLINGLANNHNLMLETEVRGEKIAFGFCTGNDGKELMVYYCMTRSELLEMKETKEIMKELDDFFYGKVLEFQLERL